ncbi:hypothetical protein [Streptacidiphilus sp. MAP5-3]|uniref:hypothetical protein n=1 Tax=unclassified Streptacidiphilus TaxID=2643834 RepID=UPI003513D813
MSTVQSVTQYSVQFNITRTSDGFQDNGSIVLGDPSWTDAEVGAFVQAMEALPLPTGCTIQVIVGKSSQAVTSYTTDTATNPITFT